MQVQIQPKLGNPRTLLVAKRHSGGRLIIAFTQMGSKFSLKIELLHQREERLLYEVWLFKDASTRKM